MSFREGPTPRKVDALECDPKGIRWKRGSQPRQRPTSGNDTAQSYPLSSGYVHTAWFRLASERIGRGDGDGDRRAGNFITSRTTSYGQLGSFCPEGAQCQSPREGEGGGLSVSRPHKGRGASG